MFPPIEPFASGYLDVGDANTIYWECCGNPNGKPALHLHGGPGSGSPPGYRRRFDPDRYLVVSFDQRGCGRSRPLLSLHTNTTQALIADIEALRTHLGVEQWLVTAASWGSTLALHYAQAYPERVTELVLFAIAMTTTREVEWVTESMGLVFPREWEQFAAASGRAPGQRLVDAYSDLLTSPDPEIRAAAAQAWCTWEDTHVSLNPRYRHDTRYDDPRFREIFATLVTHYWKHAGFGSDYLMNGMRKIAHIPTVLVHGRLDVSSPLGIAWRLHKALPSSDLVVIEDEGHGGEVIVAEVARALAHFAS